MVGPLSLEEQDYFKSGDGLLVREVWTDFGGDVAGLRPGDIVLTINGQAVTSLADLSAPAASASPVNLWYGVDDRQYLSNSKPATVQRTPKRPAARR